LSFVLRPGQMPLRRENYFHRFSLLRKAGHHGAR
jgi:hypothetical protein